MVYIYTEVSDLLKIWVQGLASTYPETLDHSLSQWPSLCVDIKVASTQVLEEAEDNKCMKVSLGKLHLHE